MMRTKLGVGLLAAVLAVAAAQTPEAMLGAALHQERVTGNLQAAIDGYRKVLAVKGVPRSIAAQAQYHLGICHEKLGHQEARKAFESVVRDYSDQKDLAAQARARLAAMSGDAGGVRARLLWDNAPDLWGKASADGRYFSFSDWRSCDVGLRDLLAGESRKVTNYDGCFKGGGEVYGPAASPDGKRIAFGYLRYAGREDGGMDLRVVAADGTGEKTLMRGGGLSYAEPCSWSADGKWIAAAVIFGRGSAEENAIALVSPESGQVRRFRLARFTRRVEVSPDGKWLAYSLATEAGNRPVLYLRAVEGESVEQTVQERAMLMGWTPDGNALLFRREREDIHDLYLLPVAAGKAAGAPALIFTSTHIEAPAGVTRQGSLLFSSDNSSATAVVLPWTGDGDPQGAPVLTAPAIVETGRLVVDGAAYFSHSGKQLLVVNPRNGITIRDLAGGGERSISPQLKTWTRARWAHDDASLLLSGTDANGRTGVHRVDHTTGKAELVAELPAVGGFAPSRDGRTIYYGNPRKTQARDLATGQDKTLFENPRGASGGGSHDVRLSRDGKRLAIKSWGYLVVVDLASGQSKELYREPPKSHTAIWAMDWSADDREIITIVRPGTGVDKMEYWTFSPDGGEPARRPIPAERRGLSFSPDGKYVATTNRTWRAQLWALENFLPLRR